MNILIESLKLEKKKEIDLKKKQLREDEEKEIEDLNKRLEQQIRELQNAHEQSIVRIQQQRRIQEARLDDDFDKIISKKRQNVLNVLLFK